MIHSVPFGMAGIQRAGGLRGAPADFRSLTPAPVIFCTPAFLAANN